jgi:hypothetical protein
MNYAQMQNAPAFPVSFKWGKEFRQYNGMTLRDYFAAQALQGFLPDAFQEAPDNYPAKRLAPFWAGMAYQLADEMLKARET